MAFDPASLRTFSAALLELTRGARSQAPGRVLHDALLALRPLVPFRSAWWGECSDQGRDGPRKIWLHGRIGLDRGFAEAWNRLADVDVFAHEWMQRPGAVGRWARGAPTGAGAPGPGGGRWL